MQVSILISLLIISLFLATSCSVKRDIVAPSEERVVQEERVVEYPIRRHIQYRLTIQNIDTKPSEGLRLWTYLPVRKGTYQIMGTVEMSHKAEVIEDSLGNQIALFEIDRITPFDTRIITIGIEMRMSNEPRGYPDNNPASFLQSEGLIESDYPKIREIASRLKQGDDYETAKAIYRWVSDNLEYAGYIKNDLGAGYAIEKKRGDCTEYATLFAALSRASGIPTRVMGGYICKYDCIVDASMFHNWAEFYYKGRWHIADPLEKRFDERGEDYIATEIFSTRDKNELKGYHRYRYESKGARISVRG